MALSSTERNAFLKAVKVRGWESVTRLEHGRYLVRSATSTASHVVTGTQREGLDHTCSCEAALHGRMCWHRAAVVMARQRAEWFTAHQRAAQGRPPGPVVPVVQPGETMRRASATLRFGGVEYRGQGRNMLDALGNATAA